MRISKELAYSLVELKKSNLLNFTRTVSNFLKESSLNDELCDFIEQHSSEVILRDELIELIQTKQFPEQPEKALPFIYSLLYLFDTNRFLPEDIIEKVFDKTDMSSAYTLFFDRMVVSLSKCLAQLNGKNSETAKPDTDDSKPDVFANLLYLVKTQVGYGCEKMFSEILAIEESLKNSDSERCKSLFYELERDIGLSRLNTSVLDEIKKEIEKAGINL